MSVYTHSSPQSTWSYALKQVKQAYHLCFFLCFCSPIYLSIVSCIKITVFLALPATVTCRLCLSEENPLEASSISTTAVETVRRTCWKNVGKNVEISINQQVSFNLWPSSRMFWQRLEQLWALKREGLMFDTHEPYWFWSRYFFMKRMGFPICNQQAIARQSTDFLQTYRMLMLINKLIAKWRPLDREIGV